MSYRYDSDLVFLENCSDNDLNDLVYILTHDSDGLKRITEELTGTTAYKTFKNQHSKYWKEIAAEIQCFGANTFATLFRGGKGVLYREVLSDVYRHITKQKVQSNDSTEDIETKLLMSVFSTMLNNMPPEELKKFADSVHFNSSNTLSAKNLLIAAQLALKFGGIPSYQLSTIIASSVSRSIFSNLSMEVWSTATISGLGRAASILAGPIGFVATTGLWGINDIAGPAYRVTVPAVIQIAQLRKQTKLSAKEREIAENTDFDIDSIFS